MSKNQKPKLSPDDLKQIEDDLVEPLEKRLSESPLSPDELKRLEDALAAPLEKRIIESFKASLKTWKRYILPISFPLSLLATCGVTWMVFDQVFGSKYRAFETRAEQSLRETKANLAKLSDAASLMTKLQGQERETLKAIEKEEEKLIKHVNDIFGPREKALTRGLEGLKTQYAELEASVTNLKTGQLVNLDTSVTKTKNDVKGLTTEFGEAKGKINPFSLNDPADLIVLARLKPWDIKINALMAIAEKGPKAGEYFQEILKIAQESKHEEVEQQAWVTAAEVFDPETADADIKFCVNTIAREGESAKGKGIQKFLSENVTTDPELSLCVPAFAREMVAASNKGDIKTQGRLILAANKLFKDGDTESLKLLQSTFKDRVRADLAALLSSTDTNVPQSTMQMVIRLKPGKSWTSTLKPILEKREIYSFALAIIESMDSRPSEELLKAVEACQSTFDTRTDKARAILDRWPRKP